MHLVLYGKPRCSLCDHARDVVEEVIDDLFPSAPPGEPEVTCVDITSNDLLLQRYRHEIPVVALDGEELCRLKVDPALLRSRLLERARQPRSLAP